MGPVERLTAAAVLALAGVLAGCVTDGQRAGVRLETIARERPDRSGYVALDASEAAGAASVSRGGRQLDARPGMTLQPGDEVETGDAAAVIRFAAHGTVVLAERTRVRIGSLEVLFGRILADVRGLFSASSENVVAGVEGTAFAFEVRPDRAVRVVVLQGVVACRSRTGAWPPLRMRAAEAMYSPYPNRTPPRVEPASRSELDALNAWAQRVRNAAPSPPPPDPLGWCCADRSVSNVRRDQCRGSFFRDQPSAQRACAPAPAPMGWCCYNGSVSNLPRDQCRGSFFDDPASARQACAPAPAPMGWCCYNGSVSNVMRDQCRGTFYDDRASADKSCRPVLRTPVVPPRVAPPAPPPQPVIR